MLHRPVRVLVAMSGGVDSSVAAARLAAEPAYEVMGITLRLWQCGAPDDAVSGSCGGTEAEAAAQAAADVIQIPHRVVQGHETFARQVLEPAWREYEAGRTPNPCVLCNPAVKFGLLQQQAGELDARWIATGHHARVTRHNGDVALLRGHDPEKDQSYFLFALSRDQLARTLLPVGGLTKEEVRSEALRLGLPNARRPESQDVCVGDGQEGFAETLRLRFGGAERGGDLVDTKGRVLGRHPGAHRFTIGQRRGLGVAMGSRAYVVDIDAARQRVVVSSDPTHLDCRTLVAHGVRWLVDPGEATEIEAQIQIRYRHHAAPGRVRLLDRGHASVLFDQPQRAITPGQAVVFYDGDRVLGGGWIQRAGK